MHALKVYKYRGSDESLCDRDLQCLLDNYFWAPTASDLNDPSESYVNANFIKNAFNKMMGANKAHLSLENLLGMRKTVGVYSLSKNPLDELMWAYYANSHKGFCVEYDLGRLIFEARSDWSVVDVVYRTEPSIITVEDLLFPDEGMLMIKKMIGTKSLRWKHEQEIRIITTTFGRNNYAPAAVSGIYFGCRCDEKFILKVRNSLKGRDIKYYKIEFSPDSYSMEAKELVYENDIDGERIKYSAIVEEGSIPELKNVKEKNKEFYPYLTKAVEILKQDASCKKIVWVDFSVNETKNGKPVIFIQYETTVVTQFDSILTRYFPIIDL